MGENKQEIVKRDKFFDVDGFATDALTPTRLKGLIAGIAVMVICSLLPLQEYGATCGLALGMLIATVIFTMTKAISIGPWGAIMVFIMVVTKIIDMSTVQAMIGSSTALMMIGLCIIGYGIEATPFGERISLLMLKKWGKKPRQIVFILFIASALLSSVLSNIAVCMLASNLGIQILERMGEEKKKSKFGKALMLSIMAGSAVGGIGFIQGSPGVNIYNQTLLQTSIGVTYDAKQWALLGFPLVILCLLPVPIVYMKFNKFSVNDLKVPSESFYDEELAKLGPVGGSEVRWVLMTIGLIVALLSGANSNQMMILFVFLACAPIIGVIKVKDAFTKAVPWETVFAFMMLVGMGKMFVNSGLTTWFQSFLTPVFSGLGVFATIFVLALSAGVLSNAMPYGTSGLAAVYSTILAPVLMAMGYNAVLILMPAIFMFSQMFCLSAHPTVMCSYMFGWYEDKDLVLPGIILVVFQALLFSVFTYFLGPVLWNTSFLL